MEQRERIIKVWGRLRSPMNRSKTDDKEADHQMISEFGGDGS